MKQEQTNHFKQSDESFSKTPNYWRKIALIFIGLFVLSLLFDVNLKYDFKEKLGAGFFKTDEDGKEKVELEEFVLPSQGVALPIKWGGLGKKMTETGVIDAEKFEEIYSQKGGLNEEEKKLLYGEDNGILKINSQNSGFLLNLLWAFGLGNRNQILEQGPMRDSRYGGAENFASTGGWILAKGEPMDHYSKHSFIVLTPEQQKLVERVSQNIYRPCCGNSTYFPDCNHGMAMLGILEIMASQGASEEEMYKTALAVNSYWFPDTYLTIAKYFEKRGVKWNKVSPKEVLGSAYSSGQGYQQILSEIEPVKPRAGAGCGI